MWKYTQVNFMLFGTRIKNIRNRCMQNFNQVENKSKLHFFTQQLLK